jgi:hypothetical protein
MPLVEGAIPKLLGTGAIKHHHTTAVDYGPSTFHQDHRHMVTD